MRIFEGRQNSAFFFFMVILIDLKHTELCNIGTYSSVWYDLNFSCLWQLHFPP